MASDLQEVIARVRKRTGHGDPPSYSLTRDEVATLLNAAEAGMTAGKRFTVEEVKTLTDDTERHARDAALEEAAQVAERLNEQQDDWLYPRRQIAFAIRALKARTA